MTVYLKSFDLGIDIGGEKACILLYAYDIVLLANTESDLQKLLDGLYTWCYNNNMTINACESNVVHFRLPSMERSKYIFKCGDMNIELKNDYTYLGLNLNEFLDYNLTAKIVAKSANRALGLVMAKCKTIGGVSYDVFKKLFDSLVSPIIEYGAVIKVIHILMLFNCGLVAFFLVLVDILPTQPSWVTWVGSQFTTHNGKL